MPKKVDKEVEKVEAKVGFSALGVFVKGKLVRTYEVELHGTRTAEYAEQYASKLGGKVEKLR